MTRAVLFILALTLALPACRGCGDGATSVTPQAAEGSAPDRGALPDAQVACPVCGLEFNGRESAATRVHGGKTYYFLLEDHARAFTASPEAYLNRAKP
jgi:YHS domain-containing protein